MHACGLENEVRSDMNTFPSTFSTSLRSANHLQFHVNFLGEDKEFVHIFILFSVLILPEENLSMIPLKRRPPRCILEAPSQILSSPYPRINFKFEYPQRHRVTAQC